MATSQTSLLCPGFQVLLAMVLVTQKIWQVCMKKAMSTFAKKYPNAATQVSNVREMQACKE